MGVSVGAGDLGLGVGAGDLRRCLVFMVDCVYCWVMRCSGWFS